MYIGALKGTISPYILDDTPDVLTIGYRYQDLVYGFMFRQAIFRYSAGQDGPSILRKLCTTSQSHTEFSVVPPALTARNSASKTCHADSKFQISKCDALSFFLERILGMKPGKHLSCILERIPREILRRILRKIPGRILG